MTVVLRPRGRIIIIITVAVAGAKTSTSPCSSLACYSPPLAPAVVSSFSSWITRQNDNSVSRRDDRPNTIVFTRPTRRSRDRALLSRGSRVRRRLCAADEPSKSKTHVNDGTDGETPISKRLLISYDFFPGYRGFQQCGDIILQKRRVSVYAYMCVLHAFLEIFEFGDEKKKLFGKFTGKTYGRYT